MSAFAIEKPPSEKKAMMTTHHRELIQVISDTADWRPLESKRNLIWFTRLQGAGWKQFEARVGFKSHYLLR
jgi:hypothetical protein